MERVSGVAPRLVDSDALPRSDDRAESWRMLPALDGHAGDAPRPLPHGGRSRRRAIGWIGAGLAVVGASGLAAWRPAGDIGVATSEHAVDAARRIDSVVLPGASIAGREASPVAPETAAAPAATPDPAIATAAPALIESLVVPAASVEAEAPLRSDAVRSTEANTRAVHRAAAGPGAPVTGRLPAAPRRLAGASTSPASVMARHVAAPPTSPAPLTPAPRTMPTTPLASAGADPDVDLMAAMVEHLDAASSVPAAANRPPRQRQANSGCSKCETRVSRPSSSTSRN